MFGDRVPRWLIASPKVTRVAAVSRKPRSVQYPILDCPRDSFRSRLLSADPWSWLNRGKFCKGPSSIPMKLIRILVADDHAVVLEGLVALIGRQSDMKIVAQASNGAEAVDEWSKHRPDVSLLDLRMPLLDAVGVINRIRETDPAARFLVLTTFDTDEDIYRAVKSGAKGYLLKDAPREILLESIRRVHAGETCLAPELTAKLAFRLSSASLTDRELDVLTLLVRGKGTREIGAALFIGETTVKSHLKKMSGKLGVIGRAEMISESLRRGLVRL